MTPTSGQQPYSYREQIFWVVVIETMIVIALSLVALAFWTTVCTDSLKSCVAEGETLGPLTFFALAALRPFVFTPYFFSALIAGPAFGTIAGTLFTITGGLISALLLATIGRVVGKRLVTPWMQANLPQTSTFLRSQDYKIMFFLRLVPLVPFDITSFFSGVLGFRWHHIVWTTIAGSLPETIVFVRMGSPTATLTESAFDTLLLIAVAVILPLMVAEYLSRRNGRSMWQQSILVYREILEEVRRSNRIRRRVQLGPDRTPVLLLYGFFSSRRALGILERHLSSQGYDVISFNLGGLLETFFTSSILDSSMFIDAKLKRLMDRHGFKKVHIVAHSKGGLVALWWLLKMGGDRYCDKVVTLGTPFKGSRLVWLALVTPLGFIWRDMWQMRPGSTFLKQLHLSRVPETVDIYCFHSQKDRVSTGTIGLFEPTPSSSRVHSVRMDETTHFEFLSGRHVTERIAALLDPGGTHGRASPAGEVETAGSTGKNALLRQG